MRWIAFVAVGGVLAAIAAATVQEGHAARSQAVEAPGWVLVAEAGRAQVESAAGRVEAVPLPPGARLSAIAALGDDWIAAGSRPRGEDAQDLLLIAAGGGSPALVAVPPNPSARLRTGPAILVRDGRLDGLAWLEGADVRSLSVRAARWDHDAWRPSVAVAAPGPGSQLGLTGAVLADGSWLLLWAAFDGEDDEILWTVGSGAAWSPPQRLGGDNRVPDVTPVVARVGDGAVAAWNRWDGDSYRTVTSRFAGGDWREPEVVGPPGSVAPSLHADAERGLWLLASAPGLGAWSVVALGPDGREETRATIPGTTETRPALVVPPGLSPLRLRLPGKPAVELSLEVVR